ncbi:MAG: single-stranded DNA-binding protein ['Conium maculatum' witches'-broom phytoplasma]|nr:single-stranded DNA-binding protein ['Conium maculatum' witches'-broom phytoplasma]MEC4558812.1 single-stranded DNA-binding protein ['Conium maculatum' witches'-broom phytoplasma]MEC4559221.1 single-stranded DNA-binding protein ['Conium maculatum' witches'-broom phytoplasma]
MINKVILVGRITKVPELNFINGNIPLVRFILAVNRNFVNDKGDKEADFIRCTVWNKQAENLFKFVTKGALIGVEGRIKVNSFDNGTEKKQFITEIQCQSIQYLEFKKEK